MNDIYSNNHGIGDSGERMITRPRSDTEFVGKIRDLPIGITIYPLSAGRSEAGSRLIN